MAMQPPPVPPDPKAPPAPAPSSQPNQQTAPSASPPPVPPEPAPLPELYLEPSIWQHPFVQNILPLITSLVLHGSLILVAVLTYQVVKTQVLAPPREQIIIPESDIAMEGSDDGVLNPGMGNDPSRAAFQDQFPEVPKDSRGIAEKPGTALIPALMGGGGADTEGSALIAIGGGGLGVGTGIGSGKGSGIGSGSGDGTGVLAPFGIPGGGGGPGVRFIGSRGAAKRIAYVCDASGSMMTMFDALRFEIRASVGNLSAATQSFNVIFFQNDGCATADKSSLMVASAENKRRAYKFLDEFFPKGTTNPIPSLDLAFKQQPELIYLLTDGEFPDSEAVLSFIRSKNADKKVKINTIAFINKDLMTDNPLKLEFVRVLQQIARENGGLFKHVSDEDMGQR